MDMAPGSKNAVGGSFSSRIVKGTIGPGQGRIFGPVDVMVSALYLILMGLEVGMNGTYQK